MRLQVIAVLALLVLLAGCSTNPLVPPSSRGSNNGPSTPGPCTDCPDTTQPPIPPGVIATYATTAARIHEAQSHATIATVTVTSTDDSVQLTVPVHYETGNAQNNERWHAYLRNVHDFNQKYDFIFPSTGTQVVPDPPNVDGWLTRTVVIGRVPPGAYDLVVQQDLLNGYHPGESDIEFDPGTATVFRR